MSEDSTEQPVEIASAVERPKDVLKRYFEGVDIDAMTPEERRLKLADWHTATGGDIATIATLPDDAVLQFLKEAQQATTDVPAGAESQPSMGAIEAQEPKPITIKDLSAQLESMRLPRDKRSLTGSAYKKAASDRRTIIVGAIDAANRSTDADGFDTYSPEALELLDRLQELKDRQLGIYAGLLRQRARNLGERDDPRSLSEITRAFLDALPGASVETKGKSIKDAPITEVRQQLGGTLGKERVEAMSDDEVRKFVGAGRSQMYALRHPESVRREQRRVAPADSAMDSGARSEDGSSAVEDAASGEVDISVPSDAGEVDSNSDTSLPADQASEQIADSQTNRELADSVADILDGHLMVDSKDRVRYGRDTDVAFRTEPESDDFVVRSAGGMFAGASGEAQLRDIAAHADEIRDGLANRGEPGLPDTPDEGDGVPDGDAIDEDATRQHYEAHTQEDEAPAEGPEMPPEGEGGDTTVMPEAVPTPELAPAPTAPTSPELSLAFIDESDDAEALARDAARARWRETLQSGGRFKRFVKNLWMGENGIAGPFVYRKYYHEALAQIQQAGDVLVHESGDAVARQRAQYATIERFQEGLLHEEAGEQRAELTGDSAFAVAVKDLIRRYAEGEFADEAAFMEERGRILEQLRISGHDDLLGEGSVRIDNMFLVAEQVKAMADHGDSIDRVLEGMKIYSGEARSHVRTEAHLKMIDRVIDKLDRSRFGGLASPEVIGGAAAIALGIFQVSRGGLATAAGITVPGLVGGGLAVLRENKRLKDDRMLHGREMAVSKEYDQNAKRRIEMETARYEAVAARDLTEQLEGLFDYEEEMTPDQIQQAYQALAAVEARVRMSDRRGADLVSFSDATMVEVERQALDIARAHAKVELAARLGQLPADFRTRIGIEDADTIDMALDRFTDPVTAIEQDMTDKDKAYNKIRNRRVRNAALIGFSTSALMGIGMQEIVAFANPGYEGLVEHLVNPSSANGAVKQTLLEGLVHQVYPKTYSSFPLGNHGNALELPSNYSVVQQGKNTFGILDANGNHVMDHIALNKNGSLTHQSVLELRQHNIDIQDNGILIQHSTPKTMSIPDYNKLHAKDVTHITRDFWNDNGTAAPKFDHNELGLSYSGKNGTGIGPNGSVRMSVAGMTEGGSWHGSRHVSWTDAADHGKLKLAITGSRGTQTEAYMVDVKPNGSINIPANSPAAKFFSVEHGHVKFHGGFVEVVETRGVSHGVTHVAPLATISGDHSIHRITENVPGERYVPHLKLTPPENLQVEGFAGPPIVMRNPLERVRRRPDATPYGYRYGGEYGGWTDNDGRRSPRLEENPGAELKLSEELPWFTKELEARQGADYLKKIRDDISASVELGQLPHDIRTLTTIPVAAASESDNIYRTLSLYAQQDEEQLSRSAILLNVNWLDSAKLDAKKRANIDKTLAEIDRARRDFPSLSIAVMQREYKKEEVERTGGVIGYVASDLMNTALVALNDGIISGRVSSDADVAIIRQDADMRGLSRHYLRQLEKSMDEHETVDIFQGVIRSDVRMQDRYPGFGIVTNFSQAMSVANAAKNRPWTVGINTVVRAGTLAAVGGLGSLGYTGPGSDDVNVGYRVSAARRGLPVRREGYYNAGAASGDMDDGHRVAVAVPGMTVDSSADRLIPQYLLGRHFGAAWDSRASAGTSFSDGPGGYRDRTQDKEVMRKIKRETVRDAALYERIEHNLGGELGHANPEAARRVLGVFFSDVPGAYTIRGEIGSGAVEFKLTSAGRRFIRERIIREVDGSRGASYGHRKMRQLYGERRGGRSTRAAEAPLVSPTP